MDVPVRPQQQNKSAWDLAASFAELDFSSATDVGTLEQLTTIFNFIRDSKFIKNQPAPLSERRLSWLFPDDGCYTRAELATDYSELQKLPTGAKLFTFGDLAVKTANHPEGIVRWWYHVVPVYRVGNQAYVVDPAIHPEGPLKVEDWKKALETEESVDKFAVCNTHTVGPEDNCKNPRKYSLESLLDDQVSFLGQEWDRLEELNRDPKAELGENPPWL